MAKLPPLTLKLSADINELRIVVEELASAFKRIDERLGHGETVLDTAPVINISAATTADADKIANDLAYKLRNHA